MTDDTAETIPWPLPVHPAAAMLPMMTGEEDPRAGRRHQRPRLQQPIIVFQDNWKEAGGGKGPFPLYVLDGRNRLAALQLLGIDAPEDAPRPGYMRPDGSPVPGFAVGPHSNVCVVRAMQATFDGCTSKLTWGRQPTRPRSCCR